MRLLLAACLAAFLTNAAPSQAAESPAAESLAAESLAASGQAGDVSAYGRLADIDNVALSPSGARLAYIATFGDHRRLVVQGLPETSLVNAAIGDSRVRSIQWAGDDHLLVFISKLNADPFDYFGAEELQVLSVSFKTQTTRTIFADTDLVYHAVYGHYGVAQVDGHWYGYFGGLSLAKGPGYDAELGHGFIDLYRVDLDSGEAVLQAHGDRQAHQWLFDAAGALTAQAIYDQDGGRWALHGGGAEPGAIANQLDPPERTLLAGLGRTPGTVIIDDGQPQEWRLSDGDHRPLPLAAGALAATELFDPATGRLAGVTLKGEAAPQQFFDPALQARYQALKRALGPNIELTSWSRDYQRVVVRSEGKGDAGTYWLIDGAEAKIIDTIYRNVPASAVGESRVVSYRAADGLEERGILTLPTGRAPKGLALVVLVHDGPEAHATPGYDGLAQAFSGQGYAVWRPNFRGSDSGSTALRDAGFGQWGRAMQSDLADGVAALAREGVIDPRRVCIAGAGYGGYAALAGVTLQQGLYRCAVSLGGITDLNLMLAWEQSHAGFTPGGPIRNWRRFLGVSANSDPALQALSPARLAGRADAPILLAHGEQDAAVPVEQSRLMEHVLNGAGKPVRLILLKGEDHDLTREEGREAFIGATVAFVEQHNPPN